MTKPLDTVAIVALRGPRRERERQGSFDFRSIAVDDYDDGGLCLVIATALGAHGEAVPTEPRHRFQFEALGYPLDGNMAGRTAARGDFDEHALSFCDGPQGAAIIDNHAGEPVYIIEGQNVDSSLDGTAGGG
jgi:hypothetical protein